MVQPHDEKGAHEKHGRPQGAILPGLEGFQGAQPYRREEPPVAVMEVGHLQDDFQRATRVGERDQALRRFRDLPGGVLSHRAALGRQGTVNPQAIGRIDVEHRQDRARRAGNRAHAQPQGGESGVGSHGLAIGMVTVPGGGQGVPPGLGWAARLQEVPGTEQLPRIKLPFAIQAQRATRRHVPSRYVQHALDRPGHGLVLCIRLECARGQKKGRGQDESHTAQRGR